MTDGTGAMQEFNAPAQPRSGPNSAGLLLLYAENFNRLPSGWPINGSHTVIGSQAPADLQLLLPAVSRLHAELIWERNGFTLRDTQSTNGVLLDGRRISEARLESNQELRIGDAILKFIPEEFSSYADYELSGRLRPGRRRLGPTDSQLTGGYQMDKISHDLARIAQSPLSVMLLGESGTGKEVVAEQLHRLSERRGSFCAINCAAIPANLLESELFGYKKGAFSGADRDKVGLIKSADGGTLLLDEIGDMPLTAQAKLLRVLQSREVFPVGATRAEPVDIRVVCATHRDLQQLQLQDEFRPDLFARLNEYQLLLPPLRDRKEDIYLLLKTFFQRHGRRDIEPTFPTMTALLQYDWPYNVRELEACAKRCVALAKDNIMDIVHLPDAIRESMSDYGKLAVGTPDKTDSKSSEQLLVPERDELIALLKRHQGNVAAVGRELGKARMQVHRWLKRHDLSVEDYRR